MPQAKSHWRQYIRAFRDNHHVPHAQYAVLDYSLKIEDESPSEPPRLQRAPPPTNGAAKQNVPPITTSRHAQPATAPAPVPASAPSAEPIFTDVESLESNMATSGAMAATGTHNLLSMMSAAPEMPAVATTITTTTWEDQGAAGANGSSQAYAFDSDTQPAQPVGAQARAPPAPASTMHYAQGTASIPPEQVASMISTMPPPPPPLHASAAGAAQSPAFPPPPPMSGAPVPERPLGPGTGNIVAAMSGQPTPTAPKSNAPGPAPGRKKKGKQAVPEASATAAQDGPKGAWNGSRVASVHDSTAYRIPVPPAEDFQFQVPLNEPAFIVPKGQGVYTPNWTDPSGVTAPLPPSGAPAEGQRQRKIRPPRTPPGPEPTSTPHEPTPAEAAAQTTRFPHHSVRCEPAMSAS